MGCYADYVYKNSKFLTWLWRFYNEACAIIGFELYDNGFYVSGPCILINIFHFIVLTRKNLRSSPIYVIMAAIALIDIGSLYFDVHREIVNTYKVFNICYPKETDYKIIWLEIFVDCLRRYTRRCSTWLSFCITFIRTLIVRYPLNPRLGVLSKPKSAYFFILGVLILCAPIHILDLVKYNIYLEFKNYKCTEHKSTNILYYSWKTTNLINNNYFLLYTVPNIVDGFISKIIPCALYPITTFLLIRGMRKAAKQRNDMVSSSNSANSRDASRLVVATTLTFFVAELPLGVIYIADPYTSMSENGFDSAVILATLTQLFSFLLTFTTATHMIICVLMSSQYRKAALSIIRCGYALKPKQTVSFVHISSRTKKMTSFKFAVFIVALLIALATCDSMIGGLDLEDTIGEAEGGGFGSVIGSEGGLRGIFQKMFEDNSSE